jgi:hypothetical protein
MTTLILTAARISRNKLPFDEQKWYITPGKHDKNQPPHPSFTHGLGSYR